MPYPEASALLLEGLRDIAGIRVDTTELRAAADATRRDAPKRTAASWPLLQAVSTIQSIDWKTCNALTMT